jgi:hypothetical protein
VDLKNFSFRKIKLQDLQKSLAENPSCRTYKTKQKQKAVQNLRMLLFAKE